MHGRPKKFTEINLTTNEPSYKYILVFTNVMRFQYLFFHFGSALFQIDSHYIFLSIIQFMTLASLCCESLVCRRLKWIVHTAEGMTHNAGSKNLFNISNNIQNVHRDWTRKSSDNFFSLFPLQGFGRHVRWLGYQWCRLSICFDHSWQQTNYRRPESRRNETEITQSVRLADGFWALKSRSVFSFIKPVSLYSKDKSPFSG